MDPLFSKLIPTRAIYRNDRLTLLVLGTATFVSHSAPLSPHYLNSPEKEAKK